MAMNRAKFRKELQLGLNTIFGMEYRRYPEEWRDMFEISTSRKAYEEDVLMVGLGAAPVKQEGAGVSYDEGAEAWVTRYTHETIALAFAITEEAEEDGLYGSLGAKFSRALARSIQHTKEIKGAGIPNNGHDTNYPGGDGKPLFSTTHPLWNGGTLSNKLSTPADFSETSLEDALIQIAGWTDDRGIPVQYDAKRIVIPPQLRYIVARVLYTPGRPGTSDNDINAIMQQNQMAGGMSINHRLTDTDQWNIITDAPDGLKHFARKTVSRGVEGDWETGNMRYKVRERYSFGWSDWRGAFSSEGN